MYAIEACKAMLEQQSSEHTNARLHDPFTVRGRLNADSEGQSKREEEPPVRQTGGLHHNCLHDALL